MLLYQDFIYIKSCDQRDCNLNGHICQMGALWHSRRKYWENHSYDSQHGALPLIEKNHKIRPTSFSNWRLIFRHHQSETLCNNKKLLKQLVRSVAYFGKRNLLLLFWIVWAPLWSEFSMLNFYDLKPCELEFGFLLVLGWILLYKFGKLTFRILVDLVWRSSWI